MRTLLLSLIALVAFAPAARAAEFRVAILDSSKAMNENDEGKAILEKIRKDFDEKSKALQAKKKEFNDLRDDFEKQMALMNDQAKQTKQADLEKRAEEIGQMEMAGQQELEARMGEAQKGVGLRVRQLAKEIAEADNIQVVMDMNATVWSAPALDITNEVIRKYNQKFPYKGEGAPAPKGTAKPASAKSK